MTVEEMRSRIEEECKKYGLSYCENKCPLRNKENCWDSWASDEEIEENYKLMFGKEETEMKNEFDFNELKAGYAIKVPAYGDELIIGIPYGENEIIFYSRQFNKVVRKEEITTGFALKEYMPIEVYGLSSSDELFDPSTRPLLWEKEDINQKKYKIGKLIIEPNYYNNGYKSKEEVENEGGIYIHSSEDYYNHNGISIYKSELDGVINALTEIRDFIEEEE